MPGQNPYQNLLPPEVTLTDDIYWNSFPPQVRILNTEHGVQQLLSAASIDQTTYSKAVADGTDGILIVTAKAKVAMQLAQQGAIIDGPIMIWGQDPTVTMLIRLVDGYVNVPDILESPSSQATPKAGSIKVSIDAKDYPAWVDPNAAPPLPNTQVVGNYVYTELNVNQFPNTPNGADIYGLGPSAQANLKSIKNGMRFQGIDRSGNQTTFIASVSNGLMGLAVMFYIAL